MVGENFEVKIKMNTLRTIARYYEFPMAVFFGGDMPEGTRNKSLQKIRNKYERIKEIIEEEE